MQKNLFTIAGVLLVLGVFGCERHPTPVQTSDDQDVDPLKAAFEESELGGPVDFNSLSEVNSAFLLALLDRDAAAAKAALAAGADGNLDCGHGCTTLMLAAATGDEELVGAVKKAGAEETPDAQPYLEILNFAGNAERPEYQAALKEIARLSGKKPMPQELAGTYKLELDAEAARTFLDKHHAPLLDNGCYVFLYEQHFALGGRSDVLWILPTSDKYVVMAFTGVNGINYGIDNYLVIRWMKRLERDHPFVLTGCGFDFLSGRFETKLPDPAAMARRMYAFCPDIVDQGTGSVEALAKELRRTNELYFWWD